MTEIAASLFPMILRQLEMDQLEMSSNEMSANVARGPIVDRSGEAFKILGTLRKKCPYLKLFYCRVCFLIKHSCTQITFTWYHLRNQLKEQLINNNDLVLQDSFWTRLLSILYLKWTEGMPASVAWQGPFRLPTNLNI